jgi:hypothetical protein
MISLIPPGQLLAKKYVPQAPASSNTFGKPSYLDERINSLHILKTDKDFPVFHENHIFKPKKSFI